jgi:hypothetical protein
LIGRLEATEGKPSQRKLAAALHVPRRAQLFREVRRRTGRTSRPDELIAVDELISPLRYDVLVRAEFLSFIRANRRLAADKPEEFMRLAREHPYQVWFTKIALASHRPPRRPRATDLYADRVQQAIALVDRWDTAGYVADSPIQVWEVARPHATATGKVVPRRYYMGDGCHRLALLHLDGVRHLEPHHLRIRSVSRFTPRDNTAVMLSNSVIGEDAYLAFLSRGYGVEPPAVSRKDLLDRVDEGSRAEVEQVIRVDDLYRLPAPPPDRTHQPEPPEETE